MPSARQSELKSAWKSVQLPLPTSQANFVEPVPQPVPLLSYVIFDRT